MAHGNMPDPTPLTWQHNAMRRPRIELITTYHIDGRVAGKSTTKVPTRSADLPSNLDTFTRGALKRGTPEHERMRARGRELDQELRMREQANAADERLRRDEFEEYRKKHPWGPGRAEDEAVSTGRMTHEDITEEINDPSLGDIEDERAARAAEVNDPSYKRPLPPEFEPKRELTREEIWKKLGKKKGPAPVDKSEGGYE